MNLTVSSLRAKRGNETLAGRCNNGKWNLPAATRWQGKFDCAVVDDAIEADVRESSGVFKTPSLILYREGACLGGIPKVRDWDDYVARMTRFLSLPVAAE